MPCGCCAASDGAYPLRVKPLFLLWESGVFFILQLVFACSDGVYLLRENHLFICLPGGGQNHFFFCSAKEKAVLDSEKEKVNRWKSWGGAVQPDVGFVLVWYPSGEGLWGIPLGSGGLRLSDPWFLLRHCR